MEFDFNAPVEAPKTPRRSVRTERRSMSRPHHRTTILTVSKRDFERVAAGGECRVVFCNDVVSSAKGGGSVVHHSIRRIDLLQRQVEGGFRKVKVRYEPDFEIECEMLGCPSGDTTDCCGSIEVRKAISKQENKPQEQ